MATKIAQANGDENGNARGGEAGDQLQLQGNGKEEVGVTNWYKRSGGWEVCIECTDEELASNAADYAIEIANDPSFGYDQGQRSTAYEAIKAAGGDVDSAADSELDCSVLVFLAYILAGLKITTGYTGNLESRFLATGKFVSHREEKYLESGDYAKKGWIYLTAGKHTAIVVTNGSKAETAANYASEADQIGPPYVQITGKVNVRETPGTGGKIIYVAHDEKLPFEEFDDDTGWYGVLCPKGMGFVSCDIPRYAKLVKE